MKATLKLPSGSPVLNAGLLIGGVTAVVGSAWAGINEWKHRADYDGFETWRVRSSTRNLLQVAVASAALPTADWYVLVPGLSSSISTMAGVGTKLANEGNNVILFNRAGYGGSTRNTEEPFHINEFLIDLHDSLVKVTKRGQDVKFHLVGHSLGAYLLHMFAHTYPDLVSAVTYLDPMHPKELEFSRAQRLGGRSVDLAFATITPFVRFGAALLYRSDQLHYAKDYEFRDRVVADLASQSVWSAAREEWKLIYPLMLDGANVPSLEKSIFTQVVAAGDTIRSEAQQVKLYEEYSKNIYSLFGVGHQSMLTDQNAQIEIVRLLTENGVSTTNSRGN